MIYIISWKHLDNSSYGVLFACYSKDDAKRLLTLLETISIDKVFKITEIRFNQEKLGF